MREAEGSGDERFFARVYALVRRLPRGRVVTYGEVAAMLGVPRGARAVGWALRALPEDAAARVPWHRVVGKGGRISPRRGPGPEIQRRRLRAEKVAFRGGRVDMATHGAFTRSRERRRGSRASGGRSEAASARPKSLPNDPIGAGRRVTPAVQGERVPPASSRSSTPE